MKRFAAVCLLVVTFVSYGFGTQRGERLRPRDTTPPGTPRQRADAPIQNAVLGFYISQFQQVAEVNDEVFAKILPFLREFIQDRFEISSRKTRSLIQLRQMVNRGGSDDEVKRTIQELDKTDADSQANQEKFLADVDPLLNTRQQAKVRIFQAMADQRIRQMLDRIQNAGPNRQLAPGSRD